MANMTLFIVGMPRSGTKLLRDLLNQHSKIAIFPNETHFFPYLASIFDSFGDVTIESNFRKLYSEIINTTFYLRISKKGISIQFEEFFNGVNESTLRSVLDSFFECYRNQTGKEVVGDKTPSYLTQIPMLSEVYPDAKYIHICRDPRDYAISINNAWNKNKLRAVQRWKNQVSKFYADSKESGIDCFNLKYEELLADPEQTLRDLFVFLGVEFEESVLSLTKPSENLGDTKGQTKIVKENFNKWKLDLSNSEIKSIENIAGSLMSSLGYELQGSELGDNDLTALRMLWYKIEDVISLFKFHVIEEKGVIPAIKEIRRATMHSAVDE